MLEKITHRPYSGTPRAVASKLSKSVKRLSILYTPNICILINSIRVLLCNMYIINIDKKRLIIDVIFKDGRKIKQLINLFLVLFY